MTRFFTYLVAAVASLLGWSPAQPQTLTTTLAGGLSQKGAMFDVRSVGPSPLVVRDLAQSFAGNGGAPAAVEIWIVSGGGSFQGRETTPGAWTLVAAAMVVASPAGTLTPLPPFPPVSIAPGTAQGFYVTCTNATTAQVAYTPEVVLSTGAIHVQDPHAAITVGVGKSYPFGITIPSRVWNGSLRYCLGTPCAPDYETNDPEASLVLDGVQSNGVAPARAVKCQGEPISLTFASTILQGRWETALGIVPLVPAYGGGLVTPGGQVINLDPSDPGRWFWNGGVTPTFALFPGPFTLSGVAPPWSGTLTAQSLHIAPSHPEGFALSQGIELEVAPPAVVLGPAADDAVLVISLGNAPLCGPAAIPFYGAAYTQIHVSSNGRVQFGGGSADWTPTVTEARTGAPFLGAWCDLAPDLGGTIRTSLPSPHAVLVEYAGVPYHGHAGLTATFSIRLEASSGVLELAGLGSFPIFPATPGTTGLQFIGLSGGGPAGALDLGPTGFAVGGPAAPPSPLAMLYAFGPAGTLIPGVDRLVFVPNPGGGYDWTGW